MAVLNADCEIEQSSAALLKCRVFATARMYVICFREIINNEVILTEQQSDSIWRYTQVLIAQQNTLGKSLHLILDPKENPWILYSFISNNEELRLLNIYGPKNPAERHEFYNTDVKLLFETEQDIIWGGDYNCTLNPSIDRKHISFNSSVVI